MTTGWMEKQAKLQKSHDAMPYYYVLLELKMLLAKKFLQVAVTHVHITQTCMAWSNVGTPWKIIGKSKLLKEAMIMRKPNNEPTERWLKLPLRGKKAGEGSKESAAINVDVGCCQ
jgi:hypothetical protein